MKKLLSLIKTSMSYNMSLFKINGKNKTQTSKAVLPIFLALLCFFAIWSYANMFMDQLIVVNLEFALLTIFVLITSILTIIEGIYKSSNLLFNCKDDDLLISLPIKKSTVLFVRIFKFYVFELLYNSLFLLPAMVVYATRVNVEPTFYIASLVALLLLPIIPIVISCVIGGIISAFSAKFKFKNIAQIIITMVFLLGIFYISFNMQGFLENIAENARSINDIITQIYYPAGAYVNMATNFNITDLLVFVLINVVLFAGLIIILSKVYYKINSKVKVVKSSRGNHNYKIKSNKPMFSLIKKELKKFISSPVFVINAGFGLVLFIVGCIIVALNFDGAISAISTDEFPLSIEQIISYFPVLLFGFMCFSILMTSITSSMISLEGKAFGFLKSLPVKPSTIINSKVLTAVLIMLPFILIGDLIMFIRFEFNVFEMLMIIIASVILPLVSETIGILVNLKYPKMDAENDTEVVKQSMSSMVAVFTGLILSGISIVALVVCLQNNIPVDLILLGGVSIYLLIYIGLVVYLNKKSVKEFNSINV